MSKTEHSRKPSRAIRISRGDHRGLVAVVHAPSLKSALEKHWGSNLKLRGFTNPTYVGNTLTVTNKLGEEVMYLAHEAK